MLKCEVCVVCVFSQKRFAFPECLYNLLKFLQKRFTFPERLQHFPEDISFVYLPQNLLYLNLRT